MHFSQGILERMLGAGDLLIESGAEAGQQRFTDVKNPDKIQNLIHSQMELNEARIATTPRGPPRVATTPASSSGWRRCATRGTLTEEEFQAHKQKLLDSTDDDRRVTARATRRPRRSRTSS